MMKMRPKQWFFKNADIIQLAVTFAATIAALFEVLENPGRLAILLGLVVASVGFGASLAILVMDRYQKRKRVPPEPTGE